MTSRSERNAAAARQRQAFLMRLAGSLWIVSVLIYCVAEAIVAAHFSPTYSYAHNFVSDLGVVECGEIFDGRPICSPLHDLMNGAFAAHGLLFLVGAVLATAPLPMRQKGFFLAGAVCYGVGMGMIGIFHGANAARADGTLIFHVIGALLGIFGGNAAALLSRPFLTGPGLARYYRRASIALPLFSLFAFVMLAQAQLRATAVVLPNGYWERAILYSILCWQGLTALYLVHTPRDLVRAP